MSTIFWLTIFAKVICACICLSPNEHDNKHLPKKEQQSLENQHRWIKCLVMRQIVYAAMLYQTRAIAFLLTERQSVTLSSWQCLLPHQANQIILQWRFVSLEGSATQYLKINDAKYAMDPRTKQLEINLVTKKDSGFYFAEVNYSHDSAVNFVEVSEDDPIDEIRHITEESEFKPYVNTLKERNLLISQRLYDWSLCSRCDKVGIKYRLAVCFVELLDPTLPIQPQHFPIFDQFFGGLPCKSDFLPEDIKQLPQVKFAKSIRLKSFCRIKCQIPDYINDEDEDWNIEDLPNASFIINSVKRGIFKIQKQLKLATRVVKTSIFQEQNSGVIVDCPRKEIINLPIIWKKNKTLLVAERIVRQTAGRIKIDSAGRIRFRQLLATDANIYSCWIGGRLVGKVQLVVKNRFQPTSLPEMHVYINFAAYIITLLMMLYISLKVLKRSKPP